MAESQRALFRGHLTTAAPVEEAAGWQILQKREKFEGH